MFLENRLKLYSLLAINYTRDYLFGKGAIEKAGELCKDLGLKGNAVLVNDKISYNIAGKKIGEILKGSGFKEVDIYMKAPNFPTMREVKEIQGRISSTKASVVFGIGGGICMDAAKGAALTLKEEIACITVPTQAATDAMCTHHAIIYPEPGSHERQVPRGKAPIATIIDMDIVMKSPYRLTATGFADWFAKYVCNRDLELAHARGKLAPTEAYNPYIMEISNAICNLFIKIASAIKRMDEDAWNMFMQTQMHDGILEILGAPLGGSEHAVGMLLQKEGKIYHGEGVALGTVLMAYHYGKNEGDTAKKALEDAGSPTTAKQLGITNEEVVNALMTGREQQLAAGRYSILVQKPLSEASAKSLAKRSGVID